MNRLCRTILISAGMFILAAIVVSETMAECQPDTCISSGIRIGFYGQVTCGGLGVANVLVCFDDSAAVGWSATCYTDADGYYYLYPKYQTDPTGCPNAPTGAGAGTYYGVANQCPTAQPCYSPVKKEVLLSSGLTQVNFDLTEGPSCCP